MDLSHLSNSVAGGERTRKRIKREGANMRGDQLWSPDEDAIVRAKYPDYKALRAALPHRTYCSLRGRVRTLDIVKKRPQFTSRELSLLRRMYPSATREELLQLFPGRTWNAISKFALRHKFYRQPVPFKPTGIVVLDQIRQRCRELKYTMVDLDRIARTRRYFTAASWNKYIDHRAIGRAVDALFGEIKADWK